MLPMESYPLSTASKLKTPFIFKAATVADTLLKNALFLPSLLFLISFFIFAMLSPQALLNGDAALYEQQIRNLDFAQRTTHLGYYLIGIPFIHLLPLPPDYALNLMNCFYGALCVSVLFLIASRITHNRQVSLIAAILLLTHYQFACNAVFAEVYVPQLFFFMLSIALLLLNKPVTAGFSYGLSFLITPSALFGLTMLIPFRRNKQLLLRFIVTTLLLALAVLSSHLSDYLSGGRGLFKASQAVMSINRALLKEVGEFIPGMLWYIPFLFAGVIEVVKDKRFRVWGMAIFLMWLVTFTVGERFGDVPVQLPTYAFICIIGGLGFHAVLCFCHQKVRIIMVGVCIFFILGVSITALISFNRIKKTGAQLKEYRDTVFALQHVSHPGFITIGPWTQGVLFEHYLYKRSYTGVWINTEWLSGLWGVVMREKSIEKLNRTLLSGQEIWLLNADPPLFSQLKEQGYTIEPFRLVFRAFPKSGAVYNQQ